MTLPVVFVIQDLHAGRKGSSEPTVTWEGEPRWAVRVSAEALGEEERRQMREAWGGESDVIDPVTGGRYRLHRYGGRRSGGTDLSYYAFDLVLEAGATGTLEVTYRQQAGFDKNRYVHPVHLYRYLLLPARGWASFGPLEIEIQAPPPGKVFFASSLPHTYADGAYRSTLPGLPDQNLLFSFMSRRGVLFGLVQPGPYYLMALALFLPVAILSAYGLGRLARRVERRGWAIAVGLGLGGMIGVPANGLALLVIYRLFPTLRDVGYDTLIVFILTWFLAIPVTLVTAAATAGRRPPAPAG